MTVWQAAPGPLQACDDVSVRYVNWGNIVRANNLDHSQRWIRRAGDENRNMAIVKCLDKESELPAVVHAHEDGLKILVRFDPCQSVCLLANGNVGWKFIQNAILEKRY